MNLNNEANKKFNQNSNSFSEISYNINNGKDGNSRKLYDNYESVKIFGRENNFASGSFFIDNSRDRRENSHNYANSQENRIPQLISNHNVDIIPGYANPSAIQRSKIFTS